MPVHEGDLLGDHSIENTPPGRAQRFFRSPDPHRRDQASVRQTNDNYTDPRGTPSLFPPTTSQHLIAGSRPTYFDADHRKRRKQSASHSETGSEADDERGATFLGLPAPPFRPRKGLKGANLSNTASPLITPSYLDEDPRTPVSIDQKNGRKSSQNPTYNDEEATKIRKKFRRRRRAELIRRISETLLLCFVGAIACMSDTARALLSRAQGSCQKAVTVDECVVNQVLTALMSHAAVVLGLYILYPLRIMFKNQARSISRGRSRFYVHIPAAFEPAPLLYPVLVPVFVALSIMQADATVVLPNLVLSIASIPSKIIPFNTDVVWYNSMQWLLSAVPVLISRRWFLSDCQFWVQNGYDKACISDASKLLMLYPLHQALLPGLQFLTTTSLLPAELQLLSISMINLLIHSHSPQTAILQSLLWLGGLSVFVLCRKILAWGVALARIPSWRFRRPKAKASEGNVLLLAIDETLSGRLSEWGLISAGSGDSDDSADNEPARLPKFAPRQKDGQMFSVDTGGIHVNAGGNLAQTPVSAPTLALDDTMSVGSAGANGAWPKLGLKGVYERQRRYTVPTHIQSSPASFPEESVKRKRTSLSQPFKTWSLRDLSKAQATVTKWLLALSVYAIVLAVIVFAVRPKVGRDALHGQEPVGWAVVYLLGDAPLFRYLMTKWNLGHWIDLPQTSTSDAAPGAYIQNIVLDGLGAANIRLLICGYCLAIICIGLAVVLRLSTVAEVDTRRKVFHGMMVAMFLPTIFVDPTFVSLAFALILAIFLLLDLFRASQLPPLSKPLTYFLAPYVDGRDHRGPVIVSHIFLLIGCAIPLWLSLAAIERTGDGPWKGWDVQRREVSMISGVVCVGMGDAAASLIGRRYGRRRWCWSGGKSLEGSLAFAIAVILGLCLARLVLLRGSWQGDSGNSWAMTLGKASIAATGASLTEAVLTGGNDNVIVPVILWLLVRGLRI